MRFGLALPHYGFSFPDAEPITFQAMSDVARRAEALGFDSLWVSDHLFYTFSRYGVAPTPIASLEAMTALAGLAAVTERARLGSLVLSAPFRHPALLAKMAATIIGSAVRPGHRRGVVRGEFTLSGSVSVGGERFVEVRNADGPAGPEPVTLDGSVPPAVRVLPSPIRCAPVWLGRAATAR
jgi:hypothetical protein